MPQISFERLREHLQLALPHFSIDALGTGSSLAEEGQEPFQACLQEITNEEAIASKVAATTLKTAVWDALRTLKTNGDFSDATVKAAASSAVAGLKQSIEEWRVYVPIENLELNGLGQLTVGGVTLYPADALRSKLKNRLCRIVNARPRVSASDPTARRQDRIVRERDKASSKASVDDLFADCLTVAEVAIEAEAKAVADLVDREVDAALDLLRCLTAALQAPNFAPSIGIHGSLSSGIHHTIIFTANGRSATLGSRLVSGIGRYKVDPDGLKHLRSTCAFDGLRRVLSKPADQRSNLEYVIATAIRWIGMGVAANEAPEKVVCFCIALEQMMNGADRGEITERLATRLAFLLSNEPDIRSQICAQAKELYGLRSAVARIIHEHGSASAK